MGRRAYSHSFAGGEMSPRMLGHIEDVGYRTGYERGRNFLVLPTGALQKRPPFEFVRSAKPGATTVRLFPFVYGDGDAYAMEWGTNHVRFHAEGSTLMYATPIPVASVTLATNIITTSAPHGLTVDEQVRITHKGTSIPGELLTGTTYYVLTTPTATTLTLSASQGGAVFDLVNNSTIDETSLWKQSELPREYVQARSVTRSTNSLIASTDHGLVTTHGDPVHFTTTGTLPGGLTVGTVYYARYVEPTVFRVALTKADAIAGTNLVTLSDAGSGTHTFHYAYYQGDIVWGGSLTILGTTSSRLFWAIEDLSTALPTVADWYQMPADGVYELRTELGAAALESLNYDQSFDVWTLCKPQSAAFTLSREGAEAPSGSSTTEEVVRWVFRRVDPSPGPPPPVLSLSSRVFGEYYNITWGDGAPILADTAVVAGTTPHTIAPGDVVYMELILGGGTAITGVGAAGFYLVTQTGNPNPQSIRMRAISGGAEVTNTSGTEKVGAIRVVGSSSKTTETYVVTALRDGDESLPSDPVTVTNNLSVPGSSNVLAWTEITDATRYRLYKKVDEAYGIVAETDQLTFTDDGIGPDMEIQPPTYDDALDTEFPRAAAHFQQRQWFGGTDDHPRRVWASTLGTISVMSYHEGEAGPLASDRIRFDVAVRERTLVRHIVPASQLWLLTSAAEIKLTGQNTDVLSPVTGIDARAMSQIGCTGVRPIVANSSILFVGKSDQHVYELPSQTIQPIDPADLSVRAAHLFDGYTLVQSAQQRSPVPVPWWIRSDGALLGMTYMPAQNIRGWHVHTAAGTSAAITSACVIPDSDGDRLYAAISRTINGSTAIYIERMGRIETPTTLTACKYLDSVVSYSGAATTSIPVAHLEGESVYAVADGSLVGPLTVTSGVITLATAASPVHAGLLYSPSVRLLPAALMADGFGKGRELNVKEATLRVEQSCLFTVGAYSEDGFARSSRNAVGISNAAIVSRDIRVPVEGSWGPSAQIVVEQASAFPLTIVSVTLDVDIGGP